MGYSEIADYFIPGFNYLPTGKRKDFYHSALGKQFYDQITAALAIFKTLPAAPSWRNFLQADITNKERAHKHLADKKAEILAVFRGRPEYELLQKQINIAILATEYEDVHLLAGEQQDLLAQAPFSQNLPELLMINTQIHAISKQYTDLDEWQKWNVVGFSLRDELSQLHAQKTTLLQEWEQQFLEDANLALLRETIAQKKKLRQWEELKKRINDLSAFFPLINHLGRREEFLQTLQSNYLQIFHEQNPQFEEIEKSALAELIFSYLQKITLLCSDYFDLATFNREQSQALAAQVLDAFNKDEQSAMKDWLDRYASSLVKYIKHTMLTFSGEKWQLTYRKELEQLMKSLAFLFWNCHALSKVKECMAQLSDAHAFIQKTGFATQNENSVLAILDLFNYIRTYGCVTETKTIISSLLKPFYPLYLEFRNIALYEKNPLWKVYRAVMPMLIIAAFIAVVAIFFTSELAFMVGLVPALILGLALATCYVSFKDRVYNFLRETYYGGPFAIPEFQVDARMEKAFGSKENASKIRDFYVKELKTCRDKEVYYRQKQLQGLLDHNEIAAQKDNTARMYSLSLEYYDIKGNHNLGCDKILPVIVAKRGYEELQHEKQDCNQLCSEMHQLIQEEKRAINGEASNAPVDGLAQHATYKPSFFKSDYRQHHENLSGMAQVLRGMTI